MSLGALTLLFTNTSRPSASPTSNAWLMSPPLSGRAFFTRDPSAAPSELSSRASTARDYPIPSPREAGRGKGG